MGKRKILAWMVNGHITAGNVPLTDLSMIGTPFDLRGYYMGQFRDRNAIFSLAEYRHMFNAGDETFLRRISTKLGFAAWAGLGSIDPDFTEWSGVMPNFGAGLRIELQPRMNFRIDVGHDPINGQTLMYFNMTEAFYLKFYQEVILFRPFRVLNFEQLCGPSWARMRPPDYEFPLFHIISTSKTSGYLSYLQH